MPTRTYDDVRSDLQTLHDGIMARSRSTFGYKRDNTVWVDQVFGFEIDPATGGDQECEKALRVGQTANALELRIIGSVSNGGCILAPAGATVTVSFKGADSPDGTFTAMGPSVCFTAPPEGIKAEPNGALVRVPIGDFPALWMKAVVSFTGGIAVDPDDPEAVDCKVDVVLSYVRRP